MAVEREEIGQAMFGPAVCESSYRFFLPSGLHSTYMFHKNGKKNLVEFFLIFF